MVMDISFIKFSAFMLVKLCDLGFRLQKKKKAESRSKRKDDPSPEEGDDLWREVFVAMKSCWRRLFFREHGCSEWFACVVS